jgi:histidine triad (HIT) family protein
MSSIFTKIINGQIPCYKIAETADYFAFLDINPNAQGHTLCVPKQEVDNLFDLNEDQYLGLMQFARTIAIAIQQTIPCNRVGMAVIGLEVPHAHIHLIPIHNMDDMRFINKTSPTPAEFQAIATAISKKIIL